MNIRAIGTPRDVTREEDFEDHLLPAGSAAAEAANALATENYKKRRFFSAICLYVKAFADPEKVEKVEEKEDMGSITTTTTTTKIPKYAGNVAAALHEVGNYEGAAEIALVAVKLISDVKVGETRMVLLLNKCLDRIVRCMCLTGEWEKAKSQNGLLLHWDKTDWKVRERGKMIDNRIELVKSLPVVDYQPTQSLQLQYIVDQMKNEANDDVIEKDNDDDMMMMDKQTRLLAKYLDKQLEIDPHRYLLGHLKKEMNECLLTSHDYHQFLSLCVNAVKQYPLHWTVAVLDKIISTHGKLLDFGIALTKFRKELTMAILACSAIKLPDIVMLVLKYPIINNDNEYISYEFESSSSSSITGKLVPLVLIRDKVVTGNVKQKQKEEDGEDEDDYGSLLLHDLDSQMSSKKLAKEIRSVCRDNNNNHNNNNNNNNNNNILYNHPGHLKWKRVEIISSPTHFSITQIGGNDDMIRITVKIPKFIDIDDSNHFTTACFPCQMSEVFSLKIVN